jgi:hypothetical protein
MSNINKKIVPIDYTSRDFNSIKSDLISHVKRYYPDIYKDFNEASFGSLVLDTVSYVGDILSFYLDYQANESFMETSLEYDNILKHARQMGYKFNNAPVSYGICSFYALIPASADSILPDRNYIPTLLKGSKVATDDGATYTLNENVNFSKAENEVVVASVDNNQAPLYYAVKAYGTVVSGDLSEYIYEVGEYQRFLKIEVPGSNITEIVSVHDREGNKYYEVDYLSQNIIFRPVLNRGTQKDVVRTLLKPLAVPRRYVVEHERGSVFLQFGYGSESELVNNSVVDPSEVALQAHGKNYVTNTSFDPNKLTTTDKFGVAPANTVLYIVYRTNTISNVNASAGAINRVTDPDLYFDDMSILDPQVISNIRKNLEVSNDEPIMGDVSLPSTAELKRRAIDTYSMQNRAVTRHDYVTAVYAMPSKFGAIKRCAVYKDSNDLKRNLNIYVISEDATGALVGTNSAIKSNAKTWLNRIRSMGDSIDILNAKIINIGIEFEALSENSANNHNILNLAIQHLVEDLTTVHSEIG